jgi:two-component system phosphate regulon sensor histidine kinase PhoR
VSATKASARRVFARGIGEWVLFAAAAIVPALAAGALGLRALANEEAARRQMIASDVARAADRAASIIEADLDRATTSLEAASFDESGEVPRVPAWLMRAASIAPPEGAAVIVSPTGRLVAPREQTPEPPADAGRADSADCRALARTLVGAQDAETKRARILADCTEVRTDVGRFLWLPLATGALAKDPSNRRLGARLAAWLEAHAAALRAAERSGAEDDLARIDGLDPGLRSRMTRALDRGGTDAERLERALASDAAVRALRAEHATTRFRGGSALGSLRPLKSAYVVGFVATDATLARALAERGSAYGASADIDLAIVSAPDATKSDLVSIAWLTDGIGIRASQRHPEAFAHQTTLYKRVLGALTALGAALAIGLATALFVRMRAARRTSELRTSFVAAVSHELRTPIASVRMLAELLEQERVEPDERAEVYAALARESRRLSDTVDRLLGFSRMAAGKLVLDRAIARLAAPVKSAVASFVERNPTARVELDVDEALRADIDAGQIEHVVANLLENARKYAPGGEPYRVGIARRGADAVLSVADRGPGIPRRHQARIFEAFERADDRLSRATEGSGIGLALVRHVAAAHGGNAWVESTEGEGATFYVSVPASDEAGAERADGGDDS